MVVFHSIFGSSIKLVGLEKSFQLNMLRRKLGANKHNCYAISPYGRNDFGDIGLR
jgi:hypothetical protein